MLRSEHSIVRYERDQAIPDHLTRITHKHHLALSQRMLTGYFRKFRDHRIPLVIPVKTAKEWWLIRRDRVSQKNRSR